MSILNFKLPNAWLPWSIIVLFGCLYLVMVFCNHYFFRTWTWDYGSYNFAFYDYAHFRISDSPVLAPHTSFLQDHVSFTFMLFIPFYWMFSWLTGTYTLSIIQTLIILYGGWAVYRIIEHKTSSRLLAVLAILQYFTLYGRWASFCSACNLAIIASSVVPVFIYYFERKKLIPALLALAFLLLAREDMALWTIFIGLFLLITHFHEKDYRFMSLFLVLISFAYFIFVFSVIIPALETPYAKYNLFNYTALGKNPSEALLFILTKPFKAIKLLFVNHSGEPVYDSVKLEFYYVYMLCGGFLLFVRPRYLLLFVPLVLKKMFNDLPVRWSIESYYSIEIVSILPIAVFLIISELKNKMLKNILVVIVCIGSLGITTFKLLEKGRPLNYDNTNFAFYRSSMYKSNIDVKKVYRQLKLIPDDAIVSTSGTINPHLVFRPKAYYFQRVDDAEYIVVFSKRDTWPLNQEQFNEAIKKYKLLPEWESIIDDSTLLILKRVNRENESF